MQNEDRSFFRRHKTNRETALVWEQTNLICRAGGQDELAVGIEGQTVHLGCVGVYCMTGLGSVVRPSVPAVPERRGYLCVKYQSERLFVCFVFQVAHIMSFWSSATDPKSDSWRRCQETSSTTAVWPVKMVLASTIFPSLGTVLMSHRQIV